MAPALYEYDAFGNMTRETLALAEQPAPDNSPIREYAFSVENAEDGIYMVTAQTRSSVLPCCIPCCIKKQYSPGRREKIRALCRTGPKTHREIKQKSHLNESDGFLVGDERIELPQVESESTALPLCKSPLFGFALSTEAPLTRNIIQPPPPFVNHFF